MQSSSVKLAGNVRRKNLDRILFGTSPAWQLYRPDPRL